MQTLRQLCRNWRVFLKKLRSKLINSHGVPIETFDLVIMTVGIFSLIMIIIGYVAKTKRWWGGF